MKIAEKRCSDAVTLQNSAMALDTDRMESWTNQSAGPGVPSRENRDPYRCPEKEVPVPNADPDVPNRSSPDWSRFY
jgi:hypothetical protein